MTTNETYLPNEPYIILTSTSNGRSSYLANSAPVKVRQVGRILADTLNRNITYAESESICRKLGLLPQQDLDFDNIRIRPHDLPKHPLNERAFPMLYSGGNMHREFYGMKIPLFDVPNNVTVDYIGSRAEVVPFDYYASTPYMTCVDDPSLVGKDVRDIVFRLYGNHAEVMQSLDKLRDSLNDFYASLDADKFHYSLYMGSVHRDTDEGISKTPRWLVVRIFRNKDFKCKGHPEFLVGQPLGQYHCPECGEMQMAGYSHL